MFVTKTDKMKVPLKVFADKESIEDSCIEQMKVVCQLPFLHKHVALMGDGHWGLGASIGSVVATNHVVITNLVGSDIGCGICAVKTSLNDIDTNTLKKIMSEIRKVIPVGFNSHTKEQDENLMSFMGLKANIKSSNSFPICNRRYNSSLKQLGSLGGGNHFIEIQKGDDGYIWIMLHSGSRNLGKKVADYYNKVAIELNQKWYSLVPKNWQLAFLPIDTSEGKAYLREMDYCVKYAFANRKLMMNRILQSMEHILAQKGMSPDFDDMINIAHNFAQMENHFGKNVMVHRKGATLARKDTIGIIPGSLGSPSYIVKGKGNSTSFNSCPHGAGRAMGRKQAIINLNLEEEIKKLNDQGIIHGIRHQNDLDEATSSYKDINKVMKNSEDLVEVFVKLQPLASIKG